MNDTRKYTPQGWRVAGESKFGRLPNGSEVVGDATALEMELWNIRDHLMRDFQLMLDYYLDLDEEAFGQSREKLKEIAIEALRKAGKP